MQKPWGYGALGGGIAGAVGGGIATGAASNNTGAFDIGNDNEDKALAVATGVIGGGLLGALVGHCLWDQSAVTPAPPPPPAAAAPPPVAKKIVLRGVNFDFDKSNIRADAAPILKEAATILKDNATLKVSVEGHTDSKGTDDYNLKLSMRRAAAVKAFLVKDGVADARLRTRGLGESQPVATNDTEDGRAQNRRVELKVE
jgi:OOP family OmpA-OmpF porin